MEFTTKFAVDRRYEFMNSGMPYASESFSLMLTHEGFILCTDRDTLLEGADKR